MRKKVIVSIGVVAVMIIIVLVLHALTSYDLSKVPPELRALKRPFQSVVADFYFDGGSIGISITDHDGRRCAVRLPNWYARGDKTMYEHLYIGAKSLPMGASTIPLNVDTKRFLIEVIEAYDRSEYRDMALRNLREATPGDRLYYLSKIKEAFD